MKRRPRIKSGELLRLYLALCAIHYKHEILDQLIKSCGLKDWPIIESWSLREKCGPVILLMFLLVLSYPDSIAKVIGNSFGRLGCGIYQAFRYPFAGGGGYKPNSEKTPRQLQEKYGRNSPCSVASD